MKILNLDELAKTTRTITLGGKEHEVIEMTVGNFIETSKAAELLESDKASLPVQMEESIKMVIRSVPSLTDEQLRKLSLEKLATILKFLRGELDPVTTSNATEGQEPGKQ